MPAQWCGVIMQHEPEPLDGYKRGSLHSGDTRWTTWSTRMLPDADQYLIRKLRHAMGLAVAATNAMMQRS